MGNHLKNMFDYQRFCKDEKLSRIISRTEEKYTSEALSDDDLELVSAAGELRIILY